jgi:putative endopeptidase
MTWQGGLGLPEREYYLQADAKMVETRTKYVAHIEKNVAVDWTSNAAESATKIMAGNRIGNQPHEKEETRNTAKLYNKYNVADLKS